MISILRRSGFLLLALLVGCGKSDQPPMPVNAPSAAERTFETRGIVRSVAADGRSFVVRHEEIPDYMPAMTMELSVRDPNELRGLQRDDTITFRLCVTKDDAWVDRITRTGVQVASAPAEPAADPFNAELPAGAPLPDQVLTNQFGQAFRLSDFKGSALALTFIFTRCPLPTYCPRMNSHFAAVQKTMKEDSARTNWQLLSISFDPEFDTPRQLSVYAGAYQTDPNHWTFATSSPEIIHKLGGSFGLTFVRESGSISHNLRTVMVDPAGRIQKVFAGNEWHPSELASELRKGMETKP